MVETIGRVGVIAALAAALASSTTADRHVPSALIGPVLVFLSPVETDKDVAFQAFRDAWASKASGRCATAELRHIQASSDKIQALTTAAHTAAAMQPAVVVAPTADAARAARIANGLPLVFASYLNPVDAQIVSTEAPRPENATGIALDDRLLSKRIDILKEAFPSIRKVALLVDEDWRKDAQIDGQLAAERVRTGLDLVAFVADTPSGVESVFRSAAAQDIDAWYIPATYVGFLAEAQIIERLKALRIPAIHATSAEVRHGALMAYVQDTSFVFDALAMLSNRVCNGERAGSIPVERPRRFMLSVRADYDLAGARIAPAVVGRADQIE